MSNQVGRITDSFLSFFERLEVRRVQRDLKGFWRVLFEITAAVYSLFLLVGAVYGRITPQMTRGFFILFVSAMIFIKYPMRESSPLKRPSLVDFLFIAL